MTASTEMPASEKHDIPDKDISVDVQKPSLSHVIEFTELVGSNGPWQIWILAFTLAANIPVAWNHMTVGFFALPQDHWCARPLGYNASLQEWFKTALPNRTVDGVTNHSQCEMFKIYANSTTSEMLEVPCEEWEYELNHLTIIKQWRLVCDDEWMVSMSQTIYMAGFLAAVLISGQMADTYGRHPIIMFNVAVLLIFGIATAFSTSFSMFAIMRFFVAMGQSGLSLTLFVLMIEVVGSEHRAFFSFVQGFGWHIGYCLLPVMAWFLPVWYHLQLAITVPCILFISFYWLLPESPRWLLAQGKLDKAIRVLEKAAKVNGQQVPDLEIQAKKLCCMAEKEEALNENATVLDLLKTPNLRRKTLNLYFIWIVIAFVYYGLSLNTGELGGDFYLNFFLSGAVEIPATIFCILVMRRFGRRKPFIFTLVGSGVACIGCVFVPKSMHWFRVTLAMLGKLLVSSSFSIVYVFSAEIFPTVARNVGVGSSSTMGRIGSMVAPFMKELGKVTNSAVPLALFAVLSIVSGILVWFLPETKGHPVPETLEAAERFGKKEEMKNEEQLEEVPK